MDTPNLPENEPEEITWQDDENRATLFLRSVFVLLSGALIVCQWPGLFSGMVGITGPDSINKNMIAAIQFFFLTIVLPVSRIWFFFGQGLRPVEWLSDQKYNAWNYGCNSKYWKLHLLWFGGIFVLPLLWMLVNPSTLFPPMSSGGIIPFLLYMVPILFIIWIAVTGIIWMICGYVLFGCSQGFSPMVTIVLLIAIEIGWFVFGNKSLRNISSVIGMLICIYVTWAALTICSATKSFAPVLYLALFATTLVTLYWGISFRGMLCC